MEIPAHLQGLVNEPTTLQKPPITTWSFSTLQRFEECPYRVYLNKVERIKEPSGPAAERGTAIHEKAEEYVLGHLDNLPKELEKFNSSFKRLKELQTEGKVELEQDWGYDPDWTSGTWKLNNLWLRVKLDVLVNETETSALIVDHKTGRKFGNEVKHGAQLNLYTLATFMRYPKLEFVDAQLWYLDKGETTKQVYTREQAMLFLPKWNERAHKLTSCTEFLAKPSRTACKWCHYGKTEQCDWVYTE